MATSATLGTGVATPLPTIRKITLHDLMESLTKGIEDFNAKPSLAPFAAGIYLVASFVAFMVVFNYDYLPLVFPVVSGAVLIGPFVTIALCEVSRRRERGLNYELLTGYNFLNSPSLKDILLLGVMMVGLFLMWLAAAMTIYSMTIGDEWRSVPEAPDSLAEFAKQLLFTAEGWTMIILGNIVGLFFAVAALCIGTISFPMLLDREVGIGVAVQTSIKAVRENPLIMALWGLIVVVMLMAGAIPFLAGLAFVIPVLGHATWHLYRKLVV